MKLHFKRIFLSLAIIVLSTTMHLLTANSHASTPQKEYLVKAAFIYNLLRFTQWSKDVTKEDIGVCIAGKNPFGNTLNRIENQKIGNKKILLYQSTSIQDLDLSKCNILFASKYEKKTPFEIIKQSQNLPILTVSDSKNFAQNGGIVEFITENGKLKFKINKKSLDKSKLKLESMILELSTIINTSE